MLSSVRKKILIMAGGTGGHIYPALSVADYLQGLDWEVVWLGTKKGLESKVIPEAGYYIEWLNVKGVRGKSIQQILLAPFNILSACYQALKIIWRHQPHVVLGMGGFVSVPGGFMSALLGKPLVIHEQNAIAGTANKVLRFLAKKVLFSFENTFAKSKKYILSGNPVRHQIIAVSDYKKTNSSNVINIVVLGGSLGAQTLNQLLPKVLEKQHGKVDIIHQCGEKHIQKTVSAYQQAGVEAKVVPFIKDMHEVYAWADIAICRSGAMTVAELAVCHIPAIFIPYPYAIDDHQTANAKSLVNIGAAKIISEQDLTLSSLSEQIDILINDKALLDQMRNNIQKAAKPMATQKVADICIGVSS